MLFVFLRLSGTRSRITSATSAENSGGVMGSICRLDS